MKSMRKLIALLLAAMMVMALALTVSADDTVNLRVAAGDEHTYNVYQIFTGTYENGALGSIALGQNGKLPSGTTLGQALNELAVRKDATDVAKLGYIKQLADLGTPFATVSGTTGISVPMGYYLIADAAAPADGESATLYVVEMVGDVTITRKPSTTSMDKKIVEGTKKVSVNDASMGDSISYQISATLPENLDYYKEYYLSFNDTLDAGLDFVLGADNKPVFTVTSGSTTLGGYSITYPVDSDNHKFALTFNDVKQISGLTSGSVVTVSYQAVLNDNAVITAANKNTAYIIYSNDPNHSGDGDPNTTNDDNRHGTFPEQKTETYTTAIKLIKVDQNKEKLTGAEFKLTGTAVKKVLTTGTKFVTDANGTYYKLKDNSYTTDAPTTETGILYASTTDKYKQVAYSNVVDTTQSGVEATAFVNADGVLTFKGLSAGTYKISEVTAPDGYAKLDKDIDVSITFNEDKTFSATSDFVKTNDNPTGAIAPDDNGFLCITVTNVEEGLKLPDTGGIGTTIFYVIGSVLVVGAGVALITKKRMSM